MTSRWVQLKSEICDGAHNFSALLWISFVENTSEKLKIKVSYLLLLAGGDVPGDSFQREANIVFGQRLRGRPRTGHIIQLRQLTLLIKRIALMLMQH